MTSISKVANIRIGKSPTFPARKGFGLLNIIGKSTRMPLGNRLRFYSDLPAVSADFSSTDEEYLAAQVAFNRTPRPSQIAISRRLDVAAPGELLGGVGYTKDITQFQAVANGGFDIKLDGVNKQVTALNLNGAANMNAVAAAVQTKLAALVAGTTCVFDGTRFIVRSGTTGVLSTVDFATAPTGAGAPTDISAMLGLNAASLGLKTAGAAIETISDSLNFLWQKFPVWYGMTFTKELTEAQIKEAAAWAEAQVKIFGFTTAASNVLDLAATNDIASFMKANLYDRTFCIWDDVDPYAVVSAISCGFSVNFNEQHSTITLKFKQLPGVTPGNFTDTQIAAMEAKNCNYYTYFGDNAMLSQGMMASGSFFDERHGLDWLQNALETNVFGHLYTRPKVAQTDKGVAGIVQQVEKAFSEGVNCDLLAPGVWNGTDLGEIKSGMFLPKGYYVYAQPVAQQNQSDRAARKAPPIQAIAKGGGAIHFADIGVTFER